jgi:hypothetical protein
MPPERQGREIPAFRTVGKLKHAPTFGMGFSSNFAGRAPHRPRRELRPLACTTMVAPGGAYGPPGMRTVAGCLEERGRIIKIPARRMVYPARPFSAAAPSTKTAQGSNTAKNAPPKESFLPAAAFNPTAIRSMIQSEKRSSEVASE